MTSLNNEGQTHMAKQAFTAADLYGANGRPHAADIDQDELFNCYFLAPIGTLGEQQPERIQDAIRFNAETGDFTVSLYRPPNVQEKSQGQTGPIQESITVSQADIRLNINKEGGGTVDNNRERSGPLWPTVIEAGFAEVYGRDARGRVNLNQAYVDLRNDQLGGSLSDGTYALTGESGRTVRIDSPLAPPFKVIDPAESAKRAAAPAADTPTFQAPTMGVRLSMDKAYTEVEQALKADKPVSLSTMRDRVNDGLEERHAYMVVGVSRNPQTNEAQLTLRNPYGNNERAREGNHHIGEGWNKNNPEITVSLDKLVRKGSFAEFNIGPAPRVQTQQQSTPTPEQATPPQPAPSQSAPTQNKNEAPNTSAQLGHPSNSAHPFHSVFNQAIAHVNKEDEKLGRKPDEKSERLSMSATALAAENGITRIDHMTFNVENKERGLKAGENLIIVQGGFNDPAHQRANMKTEVAINTPVEQSLKQLDVIQQRQTQEAQTLALQQTQDPTKIRGPSIG
jgi:Calpain family cysteine protease